MNKISKITAIILAITLLFSSCNFLETESRSALDDSFIFSNPTLADGALLGAYEILGAHGSYRNRLMHLFTNADSEMHYSNHANAITGTTRTALAIYNITPNQTEMSGNWHGATITIFCAIYVGIERLNIVLNGIREFGDLSDPLMAHVYGEALALRAFFYFDLIRWFGDVPARFSPVTNATVFLGRTERDYIYEQILEDLRIAADLLPWPSQAPAHRQRVDRMNQAFVRAFRARVALHAGGYSLRADDGFGGGGPQMRRSVILNINEMYEIARYETRTVIENAGSGGFRLENNFEQIFRDNMAEVVTVGREILFELPFNPNNRGEWASFFGTSHDAGGDMFSLRGRGEAGPTPIMWFWFPDGDVRRDVSIIHHVYVATGDASTARAEIQRPANSPNVGRAFFGRLRHEWAAPGRRIATNDDGIKPIVMRYADVLLMYAEATNFLNDGPTPSGIDAFLQVRNRAFPNGGDPLVVQGMDYTAFFQAIMDERAFEFLGEQRRRYDLIRWNRLKHNLDWARRQTYRLRGGIDVGGSVSIDGGPGVSDGTRDIDFSGFPRHIYWRHYLCPRVPGVTRVEIFGLRRGEFPREGANHDGAIIDPENHPVITEWLNSFRGGDVNPWNRYIGTGAGNPPPIQMEWIDSRDGETHPLGSRLINNAFYLQGVNPDMRSLFPIWTIPVVNSQGALNNRPFYE